jgi:phage-related minor tail protein
MAESVARQLQKSPGSAIRMVETICHAMDETLGKIQTTVDDEQSVPSIYMTTTKDLREDQNRAAALEQSSDEEDAKIMYEELSRQSLHHQQNADHESRSFFA